jgi:hypothetical protein
MRSLVHKISLLCCCVSRQIQPLVACAWMPTRCPWHPPLTGGNYRRRQVTRSRLQETVETKGGEDSFMIPHLHHLLVPSDQCNVDRMSATDLAYIGDVVYELFIRTRTVWPPKKTSDLQEKVVALVRGKCLYQNVKRSTIRNANLNRKS